MGRQKKPPRLFRRKTGLWVILDGGKQISTGAARTEGDARLALARYVHETGREPVAADDHIRAAARKALRGAQWRASKRGRAMALSERDILEMYERQGGVCAITGVQFTTHRGRYRRNPFGLSIDRIRTDGGYTIDNIRLVLTFVNLAINDFGEDVFRDVLGRMLQHEKKAIRCDRIAKPSRLDDKTSVIA